MVLFIVIPLTAGYLTRRRLLRTRGEEYFRGFLRKFENITVIGLLLTLIIIFSFQGAVIIDNPLHIGCAQSSYRRSSSSPWHTSGRGHGG